MAKKTKMPERKAKAARMAAGQATPAEAAEAGQIVASGNSDTRAIELPKGARSIGVGRQRFKANPNGIVEVPKALAFILSKRPGFRLVG